MQGAQPQPNNKQSQPCSDQSQWRQADLQHDGQLLGRPLVWRAVLQPELKGGELLREEGRGLVLLAGLATQQLGQLRQQQVEEEEEQEGTAGGQLDKVRSTIRGWSRTQADRSAHFKGGLWSST